MQPLAARLAVEAKSLKPGDLALAFHARQVTGGQVRDQFGYAFAQLQREVGGGGTHQLTHILNRHFVTLLRANGVLGLAHFFGKGNVVAGVVVEEVAVEVVDDEPLGDISSKPSSSACVVALIALSSPISQPWLYAPCTGL